MVSSRLRRRRIMRATVGRTRRSRRRTVVCTVSYVTGRRGIRRPGASNVGSGIGIRCGPRLRPTLNGWVIINPASTICCWHGNSLPLPWNGRLFLSEGSSWPVYNQDTLLLRFLQGPFTEPKVPVIALLLHVKRPSTLPQFTLLNVLIPPSLL